MNFTVTVPVKPYVKRFMENNYGCPVDFRNHPRENEMFRRMLKKPCFDEECMYKNESSKHKRTIDISISERDFCRNGWELSRTDIISFGKYFEKNAKWLMRSVISIYVSFGIPTNIAILKFQSRFNMEEEYWPFESIVKDFSRFKANNDIDFNHYAYLHLEKLVLKNMSIAGGITNHLIKKYDQNMAGQNKNR